MQTIRTKVKEVNIGKYDVDSITVIVSGETIEICFDKEINVSRYLDTNVVLTNEDGKYSIQSCNDDFKTRK